MKAKTRNQTVLLVLALSVVILPPGTGQATDVRKVAPAQQTRQPVQTIQPRPLQPAPSFRIPLPVVQSVTADHPTLAAGGEPVTITLTGNSLNLITSVQVVQNGQAVPNLTARLGAAAAASRQVTLNAQSGAPSGKYQVRLLAGEKTVDIPLDIVTVTVQGGRVPSKIPATQGEVSRPVRTMPRAPRQTLVQWHSIKPYADAFDSDKNEILRLTGELLAFLNREDVKPLVPARYYEIAITIQEEMAKSAQTVEKLRILDQQQNRDIPRLKNLNSQMRTHEGIVENLRYVVCIEREIARNDTDNSKNTKSSKSIICEPLDPRNREIAKRLTPYLATHHSAMSHDDKFRSTDPRIDLKSESEMEEIRNKRQEYQTMFENFDQKANQLFNILSTVMTVSYTHLRAHET